LAAILDFYARQHQAIGAESAY